jgi:hypothetical protein
MKTGDRIYNTHINRAGIIVNGPYVSDSALEQVAEVVYDAPYGNRSVVPTRKLVLEREVR